MPRSSKCGATHRCPSGTTFEFFDKPTHTISFEEGLVEKRSCREGLVDCATEIRLLRQCQSHPNVVQLIDVLQVLLFEIFDIP